MKHFYLNDHLSQSWPQNDPFGHAMKLEGELFRDMPSRRTLRFINNEKPYFAKIHTGVGWGEIVKNYLTGRQPIVDASTEWKAIQHLTALSIDTMTIAGYGVRGTNPARRQSFLITESLENTESLEDFCKDWQKAPPDFRLKSALIKKVALVSRSLHQSGLNHRDYYICHFLLDLKPGRENLDYANLRLHLIDLHRSQIRSKVPARWIIKDLGSLYFSALDIGLTGRDILRFIRLYSGQTLKQSLIDNRAFWKKVESRAVTLYQKMHNRPPHLPL